MFAIEMTQENRAAIVHAHPIANEVMRPLDLDLFFASPQKWYFISGYIARRGPMVDWTILPAYIFEDFFDYDAEKIKTDWTNAVRIEKAP